MKGFRLVWKELVRVRRNCGGIGPLVPLKLVPRNVNIGYADQKSYCANANQKRDCVYMYNLFNRLKLPGLHTWISLAAADLIPLCIPGGCAPRTLCTLGGCHPQTLYTLMAAPPNPCVWGLRRHTPLKRLVEIYLGVFKG